jgi:hypothetical protein
MGDDMFGWNFDEYENFAELQFVARTAEAVSALDARRTLEAAVRKIPDSALRGLQLLRITVVSGAKKGQ